MNKTFDAGDVAFDSFFFKGHNAAYLVLYGADGRKCLYQAVQDGYKVCCLPNGTDDPEAEKVLAIREAERKANVN